MKPELFDDFVIPIHNYGLMIVIGFLGALAVITYLGRKRQIPDVLYDLGMVMLLSGILGGRTFYYLQNWETKFQHESWFAFFEIWKGGLVFYGAAIGGFLGGLAFVHFKRLPWAATLDVTAVGAPVGMAVGRIGCFLNGCCFGRVCDDEFVLGIDAFPKESAPYAHQVEEGWIGAGDPMLPIHGVQLYQSAHDFLLFGVLFWYVGRGRAPDGAGMPLLWVLYGIGRFFLEGLRGDNPATFSGLTISQNVSIVVTVLFGSVLIFLYRRDLKARAEVLKNRENSGLTGQPISL